MQAPPDRRLLHAVREATVAAFEQAEIQLPRDVTEAIRRARLRERNPVAIQELENILENVEIAGRMRVPICQDTGVPICYLTIPSHIPLTQSLLDAIAEGVEEATSRIPLRPNVVDPCTRKNTGRNTGRGMPVIHVMPGERLSITAFPKGAGSENASRVTMLLPTRRDLIRKFVMETVLLAGGMPCPPVVLGVGIGSTFEGVTALAKEALLEPIGEMSRLERTLCESVNSLGIGPMGLGGDTTALAVKVRIADCHTASLPVAVNVQCWACRRATVLIEEGA